MAGWDSSEIKIEKEGFYVPDEKKPEFKTWYRVWGTGPINCLFFHGGPGQAVSDYKDTNMRILDPKKYTVLEVDQIGTGKSTPSLRDGLENADVYKSTTARDVARNLLGVADMLGWDKIFLHGGSWGSTLALLFAEMFPERVRGMVIRGIFLGTLDEMDVTFSEKKAVQTENIKKSFGHFMDYAVSKGFSGDRNSSQDVLKFFLSLFLSDNKEERDLAAWNWWVHELWAMNEINYPFNKIDPKDINEARSVAFWECSLMYNMVVEGVDLIADVDKVPDVPIYIVHGKGDFLCPMEFAEKLEKALIKTGHTVDAQYIDSGHKVTNEPILEAVRAAAEKFASQL